MQNHSFKLLLGDHICYIVRNPGETALLHYITAKHIAHICFQAYFPLLYIFTSGLNGKIKIMLKILQKVIFRIATSDSQSFLSMRFATKEKIFDILICNSKK